MLKNTAGQVIELYAYDYSTGAPKTGDAANLTFYVRKDGGSVSALTDTSAAELSSTNAPGWYSCDVAQAESNFYNGLFSGKSATANVVIVGARVTTRSAYAVDVADRLVSMLEAASGSPGEFRFTSDALDRIHTSLGMQAGNLDAQFAAVGARLPAALVGGRMDVSVGAMAAGVITQAAYDTTAGPFYPLGIIDQGTAQSATSTTLRLRSAATFGNDEVLGSVVVTTGGSTGVGQSRTILDYDGSTDTATVAAWVTTPTGTITYKVYAAPPADSTAADIKTVTDKLNTMLELTSGSPGEYEFTADALRNSPAGAGGGGGGSADWSGTEREQIRHRLGIDGTASAPSATPSLASASLLAVVDTVVDSILVDTAEIGAAGAGLTALASASNLAVVAGYLDTEIGAIKAVTDKLDTTMEASAGSPADYRFTDEALVKTEDVLLNAQRASHRTGGSVGEAIYDTDIRGRRTVLRGTVGSATSPSTTQFTPSAMDPAGVDANQFIGRIILFDKDTTTAALRGQGTDITATSAAALPLFTFTALSSAAVSGDTFSIV